MNYVVRIIPVLCIAGIVSGCSDPCSDTVITKVKSPDGAYVATMFQRDCGATTAFSTQISILKAGETLSGGGNAFIADDNHGAATSGEGGGPWATVQWAGSRKLLVRYSAPSRLFLQKAEVLGISISYSPE